MKLIISVMVFIYTSILICIYLINFPMTKELEKMFVAIPALIIGFAGFGRVCFYHPRYRHNYYQWLKATPWNGTKLPSKEVTFGLEDVYLLLVTCVFYHLIDQTLMIIFPIFTYLAGYSIALLLTFQIKTWLIPAYLIPLMAYLEAGLLFSAVVLIAFTSFLVFLYTKDRRKCFPEKKDSKPSWAAWRLSPVFPDERVEKIDAKIKLLLVFLLPTWITCFREEGLNNIGLLLLTGFAAAILKWLSYGRVHYCTGFIYRLKKLVLWDQAYDKILIAPLSILFLTVSYCLVDSSVPVHNDIKLFFMTSILSVIAFYCGPKYYEWHLTGKIMIGTPSEVQLNRNDSLQKKLVH